MPSPSGRRGRRTENLNLSAVRGRPSAYFGRAGPVPRVAYVPVDYFHCILGRDGSLAARAQEALLPFAGRALCYLFRRSVHGLVACGPPGPTHDLPVMDYLECARNDKPLGPTNAGRIAVAVMVMTQIRRPMLYCLLAAPIHTRRSGGCKVSKPLRPGRCDHCGHVCQ